MSAALTDPAALQASGDLALRVLYLEQQLDSYQRLHTAELDELRRALMEVKKEVLSLASVQGMVETGSSAAGGQEHHSDRESLY